jgi:hypothetical protein
MEQTMDKQMVKFNNPRAVRKVSPTKIIEIHSVVQKPIRLNAILVSLIVLALVLLAMVPVRTKTNYYERYYERPLIVWVIDQVRENLFIWDPTQVH